MSTTIEDVENVLSEITPQGRFAIRQRCPSDDLHLEVKGVGPIQFPILPRVAKQLISVARPAPYGRGEQTLHDASVRDTWEIGKSKIKIDGRAWRRTLKPQLAAVRERLGLPAGGELKAVLHKLLIYEGGQKFVSHQDSEVDDDMVGSLVVVLPSRYSGGALVVEHNGVKETFRALKQGPGELVCVAFYGDCRHEVRPVKSGYRIVLSYHLIFATKADVHAPAVPREVAQLAETVQKYFATPTMPWSGRGEMADLPDRLVYLLDHEYTERSLSWERLKNGDRLRVQALVHVAEALDCERYLALADVHESWSCEEAWASGGWRGRSAYHDGEYNDEEYDDEEYDDEEYDDGEYAGDDDAGDDSGDVFINGQSYDLIELYDSDIELSHFIDAAGQRIQQHRITIGTYEVCATTDTGDLKPYRSEHEGYMGNYGNTLDRWYHRSALVMWPRSRTFAIRAKMSPPWAVDQMVQWARNGKLPLLREKAVMLLPFWSSYAGAEHGKGFFKKLLSVVVAVDDAELALALAKPLNLATLAPSCIPAVVAAVAHYGLSWSQELFVAWDQMPRSEESLPWLAHLPPLCQALIGPGAGAGVGVGAGPEPNFDGVALASWLLARQVDAVIDMNEQIDVPDLAWPHDGWLDRLSGDLVGLFASAAVLKQTSARQRLMAMLMADAVRFPPMTLAALLRHCRKGHTAAETKAMGLGRVYRRAVDGLTHALERAARGDDDWSIVHPLPWACRLCGELTAFLASADRVEYRWPLAEEKRRHVHAVIDSHRLPVSHTTIRSGRPFTLHLRKLPELFTRDRKLRAQQRELLKWLKKERAAFRRG